MCERTLWCGDGGEGECVSAQCGVGWSERGAYCMSHAKKTTFFFKSPNSRFYSFVVELLKIRIEPCNLEHWASASSLIMYICATVCFAACRTAAPCKLLVVAQSCAQSAQIRRVYACMHVQVCMYTCM